MLDDCSDIRLDITSKLTLSLFIMQIQQWERILFCKYCPLIVTAGCGRDKLLMSNGVIHNLIDAALAMK